MPNPDRLGDIAFASIERVTFYKRDELTSDLICCELVSADETWTFHEEMPGWDALIVRLGDLPGFRGDWFATVSQRPFVSCEVVAFER